MLELFIAEPDTIDLREVAGVVSRLKARLVSQHGQKQVFLDGDPERLAHELIRLASIGQAFLRAASREPHQLLRSVRDHDAKLEDVVIRDLLAGHPVPRSPAPADAA